MTMKDAFVTSPEYRQFISELEARVLSARISVGRAANRDIILLYWDIGRGIVEKQERLGWGNSVVEMVARDLQRSFAASKSFSPDNLWRMRQLYLAYSAPKFLGQVVPEIQRTVTASKGTTFLGQAVPEKAQAVGLSADATQSVILDLLAAVPWGQNLLILKKIDAPAARLYYLRATAQFGWTRIEIARQSEG